MSTPSLSVVIPAYNRPAELQELLASIVEQSLPPREVVVCADFSPRLDDVVSVCWSSKAALASRGTRLVILPSSESLGFDKNVRKAIESASSDWALIMGDDDLLLPDAILYVSERLGAREDLLEFYSRAVLRFRSDTGSAEGTSRLARVDCEFRPPRDSSRNIFRAARFISGLVVGVDFAREVSTARFDGLLYYQVYLAAMAFCRSGIGYIAETTVAGRTDNAPLFGNADVESDVHEPGRYSARARVKMWNGVLEIVRQVGEAQGIDLVSDVRRELAVRESFHVFEMNAGAPRTELCELRKGLTNLRLYSHPVPKLLFALDFVLGRSAGRLYRVARRLLQR